MIYIWERDKGQEDNYTTCGRHDRIVRWIFIWIKVIYYVRCDRYMVYV
jgi:hypothetical protein